jgi:B12-binding domain/radical SAM domain protein
MIKHGLKDIRFITPNALSYGSEDGIKLNLKAVEELLSSVKKIKGVRRVFFGSFPSEVRPEHVTEESVELIKRYADNDNLVIGAQSGSDRILKLCGRKHTVEDVYRAVKIAVKNGFKAKVDFIFGFPDETEDDIKQTINFMEELTKLGASIHAHFFMPLPKTPFAAKKPKPVDLKLLRVINKLTGKGLLFGNWKQQEQLAFKIYDYLHGQFDNISTTLKEKAFDAV